MTKSSLHHLSKCSPLFIFLFVLLVQFRASAQCNCTPTSSFPATVNGITVSLSNSGSVTNYGNNWPSCGLSAGPMWVGSAGAFSQTFTFSQPVNTVYYVITAASGFEAFTFSVSAGVLSATQCGGTCPFTQLGNTFTCNGNDDGTIVVLNSTSSYTAFTVWGAGGSNGSLAGICIQSFASCSTPTLAASPSTTVCSGSSQTLTISGASSYSWTPATGLSSTSGASVVASPSVTTTYTVTGTTGTCTTNEFVTLSVIPGPTVQVTPFLVTICPGSTVALTASGTNTYSWNPSTGLSSASGPTVDASPGSTTVYTVTGSNGGVCDASATVTVNVVSSLALTVSPQSSTICAGSSVKLTASGSASYTWTPGSGLSSATGSTVTASPSATTIYTVMTSNGSCAAVAEATITVNQPPLLTLSPTSVSICAGSSTTLSVFGASSYSWSPALGLSSTSGSPVIASPAVTTVYSVTGTTGSCTSIATTTVNVVPMPVLSITTNSSSACGKLCVNFSETSNLPGALIQYNFGDGSTGTAHNPSHCYEAAGTYSASATITDQSAGCTASSAPIVLTVYPEAVAQFTITEGTTLPAGSIAHAVNTSTNAVQYLWSLCGDLESTGKDLITPALNTGNCCISLLAISDEGCRDSVTKCIDVVSEPFISIPNVFTPNNDARNDVFRINASGIRSFNCSIFDRWGLKMYEWNDVNGSWDGKTKNGAPAPDGSYFFIIHYTDSKDVSKTEKGFLSLFRN
jgi:gliding motility-associated-like protein